MDLIGKKVFHKMFKDGVITQISDNSVYVKFSYLPTEKKFIYPDCFANFLKLIDSDEDNTVVESAKTAVQETIKTQPKTIISETMFSADPIKRSSSTSDKRTQTTKLPELYSVDKFVEYYGNPDISVKHGEPDFSVISEGKFKPKKDISPNRGDNFIEYYKQLANEWSDNVNKIPEAIKKVLSEDELNNITSTTVKNALSKAELTMHEGADGMVYFVDTYIHSKISHSGGVGLAKLQERIAASINDVESLVSATPDSVYGTLAA